MHAITTWEACRSGAGITLAMTDAGNVTRKVHVKKIKAEGGAVIAIGGDGARFLLNPGRDTSAEVAAIAGALTGLTGDDLWARLHPDDFKARGADQIEACDTLAAQISTVAGSALGQAVQRG